MVDKRIDLVAPDRKAKENRLGTTKKRKHAKISERAQKIRRSRRIGEGGRVKNTVYSDQLVPPVKKDWEGILRRRVVKNCHKSDGKGSRAA